MTDYAGFLFLSLGALSVFLAGLALLRHGNFLMKLNGFVKFAAFALMCLALGAVIFCGLSWISLKIALACVIALALLPAESRALSAAAEKAAMEKSE